MAKDLANLPADILSELFAQASCTDPPRRLDRQEQRRLPGKKYSLGWILMTHVCRPWRVIGLDLAPLWAAIISFFPSPSVADELLARSRDCGLTLELRGQLEPWVIQHIHRASELEVGFQISTAGRDVLTSTSLPALHCLTMRRSFGDIQTPSRIDAPNLRRVSLYETVVLFDSIMHHLTTLEIIHVYCTPQDMIDTLNHLPSLEHLKLYRYEQQTDSFPQTTVHLPHLARCNVHSSSAQFFMDLWEHVSAPPTVTMRLVTNDVPGVSRLFKALRSQLTYAAHDSLIVHSSGFSLTCGEPDAEGHHVAGVDWLFASGIDLGRAFIDMIEQIRLHIAVASIRHCELELSSELKDLQFDDADPLTKRLGDALGALSEALSSTTALALQGFEPDRTLLRALSPRGTFIPFPNLRTLYLGKNQFSWVGRHWVEPEPAVTTDWFLVGATLDARKKAGVPLHILILAGEWCIREAQTQAWTEQWVQHSIQCRDLDLVKEVKDARTLVTKCEKCDIPELESRSGSDLSEPEWEESDED